MSDKKAKISAYGVRIFDDCYLENQNKIWYLCNRESEFEELYNTKSEMERMSSCVDPDDEISGESFALYEKSKIVRAIDEVIEDIDSQTLFKISHHIQELKGMFE